ncbi:MAG TPA: enoyl-CoA hydratase/isomerase family protein [Rhizomicrobium sp.]
MSDLILRQDVNGCATLSINRPEKLNALTVGVFKALRKHIDDIAADTENVGMVVVCGTGQCFSAGHDLADIAEGEHPPGRNFQADTIERLANLPQVVVSAVRGYCYTGGLELALAGDLIVAAESARFADTHAKWALTPVWGLSQRLPRRVGLSRAREMVFTCRTYSGQEAAAIGLANSCVPDAEFDAYLDALSRQILENSWFSHRANKRLFRATDGLPLSAGLAEESFRTEGGGPDALERIARFSARKSANAT